MTTDPTWFRTYPVPADTPTHWAVGPLDLWAVRRRGEWQLHHREDPDRVRDALILADQDVPLPEGAVPERFATDDADQELTLRPAVADRPVVVRPDPGLWLVAGAEVQLFVSTPAWIEVSVGRGGRLLDLPCTRPSDTWFGANTLSGELCYAGRTAARLDAASLPRRAGRVFTEVTVRNEASEALRLERLLLPCPHLPLFADHEGALWTASVRLTRTEDAPEAAVHIAAAPTAAGAVTPVASPRVQGTPSVLVRALGALLS